jgi:hypothetical protein
MDNDSYSFKEVQKILKLSESTLYRRVREGDIPYKGRRPMRYPKGAINALAELEPKEEDSGKLTFKSSTVADMWAKQEVIPDKEDDEDSLTFKVVAAWRQKHEEISMHVNEGGKVLGWTVFLPLEQQIILELIEGKRKERDILPEAIRKWDSEEISVYIPILEVFPTSNRVRDKRVAAFLIGNTIRWALTLNDQCDIQNWYAIVSRSKGKKLVERLGFEQINTLDDGERECYKLQRESKLSGLVQKFVREYERNSANSQPHQQE